VQSVVLVIACVAARKGVKHVGGQGSRFTSVGSVSARVCGRLVAGDQGALGGSLSGDL